MVEKNDQMRISDDDIISKFSDNFSLKLLSPLIRLKKELRLSLPDLVSRHKLQDNLGAGGNNGVDIIKNNGVETRRTTNGGSDLDRSILQDGKLESTYNESELLQSNLESTEAVNVNATLITSEKIPDKQAVQIKRKRGRPPKKVRSVGANAKKAVSPTKAPHCQSTVLPTKEGDRQRKDGLNGHGKALSEISIAAPVSRLHAAASQTSQSFPKSKFGSRAGKHQIIRKYPLRKLLHSRSRLSRFPRYGNSIGQITRKSSDTISIDEITVKTNANSKFVAGKLLKTKEIPPEILETINDISKCVTSDSCSNPGVISMESSQKAPDRESSEDVPSTVSSAYCAKEKSKPKKLLKSKSKVQNTCLPKNLPSSPLCVDRSAEKKLSNSSLRCQNWCNDSVGVYDFTDSSNDSACEPAPPPPPVMLQRKRGRPPKQKNCHAQRKAKFQPVTVSSSRTFCRNQLQTKASNNCSIVSQDHVQPVKKRGRGRPRKNTRAILSSQKNCRKESQTVFNARKGNGLHQESECSRILVETELPIQQEKVVEERNHGTEDDCSLLHVPKVTASRQDDMDVLLLHNIQPNPVENESGDIPNAMQTPDWKDKSSEYQMMNDEVSCLTPPGSNECLSISGDDKLQIHKESFNQKSCQSPSKSTISSSYTQDFLFKDVASSPLSHPNMPNFDQDKTIIDKSSELPERTNSCSPCLLPENRRDLLCSNEYSQSMTEASQENAEDSFTQESDGLSQIRITKTISLSQDKLLTNNTGCNSIETLGDDVNSIVNENDIPVPACDDSSISQRRERENIFQALRGGLNSPPSNLVRDNGETESSTLIQQEDCNQEQMSLSDSDIPHLEAYGGCHYGHASNVSPHSGASDTLPILEKEAFHDTWPSNNNDDEDEFEFENPSGDISEFEKPSESVSVEDSSKNWPDVPDFPQSNTGMTNAAEEIYQDIQKGDIGIQDDEDEFEFETPEEDMTIDPSEKSPMELSTSCHVTISDSSSRNEGIHDGQELLNEIKETEYDEEQNENSFPNLGLSPNPLGCSGSLQGNSTSGNSTPIKILEFQDRTASWSTTIGTASQATALGIVQIPAPADIRKEQSGNDTSIQEVCKTQESMEESLSVRNPGNITKNDITIISDQKNECRLPDIEMVQEDKEIDQKTNNIPDSLNTQDLGQDKLHSALITLSPEMENEDINSGEMMDIPDSNVDEKLERDEQCIKTSTAEWNVDPIKDGIEEQSREMKASAEYDVGENVEEQDEPSLKLNNTSECNLGLQIEGEDKSSSEMKDTAESIGERDGKLSEQMESTTECIVDPIIEEITFGECTAEKKFEEPDEQSSKKNSTEESSMNSNIEGLDVQMSDMKAPVQCFVAGKMVECNKDSPIASADEKYSEVNKHVECIVESSEESNNPQEIEKEHLQSNVPGEEMVQVPESDPADTNNFNSSYHEQLPVSESKGLHNNSSDGDLKCCKGKKKLTTKFTPPYGNDITGHVDRATQDGNDCGGNLPSSVHIEESKSEKEKQDSDLQQVQDIRLHTRPKAEGQPCDHVDSDTEIISDMMVEILSNVSVLQDQIVEHATSPVSEELQGTLESTEGIIEVVPTSHENRSNAVDLHEQKKKPLEFSSLGPDVNEISSVSSPKPNISLDTSQSIELQGATVAENTMENVNSLSGDFQNESDLHNSQMVSLSQCNLFIDTLKKSSLSSEQDTLSQEKVQGQSADHQLSLQLNLKDQKSTTLEQIQNDFTTEHLEEECPEETATKDQTILAETPCHDEGSKTPTDTVQLGNNLLNEPSKMSEELVNLIDASKESYQNNNMFLGASAGDETMDMLSIACEETVGGYEEDAMSTTSSGGATIAYPLSDGDNWDDPSEGMVGNVVEVEEHQSSPVPDMTNPTTSQQRTDIKHTLTACKWTVTFRKVKKRKRSKERHHKKSRSKKHKKRHEPSKPKQTDTKQKCHLKTDLGADREDIFVNETADTTIKLVERMEVDKDENPKLLLQKQTIDSESCDTRESRNHMGIEILEDEKDGIEQSEAPKSPEMLQMASISSPAFNGLHCPDTQTNQSIETNLESVPLETHPLSGRIDPISTNEEVQEVSDSDKRPKSDDYKLCEPVIGDAEDMVTVTSVDDPILINDVPSIPPSDQKLCNVPVTAGSPASRVDISLPSVSLPNPQDVTLVEEIQPSNPPWQGMENVIRESTNLHSVQKTAGKGSRGAKTVPHITRDKATFFGTPRRDKSHFRPNINIGHSISDNRFYLPHAKQSPHSLPQSALQMMHVRQSYRNPSGACKELKQHLLNKQRLAAPGSQNQFPQSHLPLTNKEIVSNQNVYSAILPSERDLALNQQRQSQIEVGKKHEGAANRHNSALPFLQVQTYQEQFQHFPPRTLPGEMNLHHSRALNSSNISTGVGHRDIDRLQPHGNRVATAGTFSPPCADDLQRNPTTLHMGQIHEKAEKSKVGYLPVDNQLGYAENIPVFTAKGPEKQLIAVYPDGYVPVPQTEISTHLNIQQNLQHARKLTPTLQHPHSNTGMSISKANMDRDEMLLLLRQLHGGNGAKSMRNYLVNLDQFGTRTSGIPPLESPHIHENTRLNQVPALIQKPSQTSTALHQLPNHAQDSHLQNPLMMEHVSQIRNTVDAQHELFHPHSPQSSQSSFLAGAPSSFHNMTSSIPTPRMHSRTPTPVSTTTSTSDIFTNQSQLPSTPLSRTSTPRSRCTPSSTPHIISESPLPGQTEILHSSSNNCSAKEDVPLDLTCKGRTRSNVDKNPTAPLDLSCKPILCDTESQEQNAAQVPHNVHEESRKQETLRRSHSEEPGSDIVVVDVQGGVDVNGGKPQDPVVLSCGSSDLSSSINSCIPDENRSAEGISPQDQNIPRQDVNIDLLRIKLGLPVNADNSSIPVNYQERSEKVIDLSIDRNVYMDRAGGPHAFRDLLHHGLTSEGPGLKIAKTYNKFAIPVTSTLSSIPLIDLTSIAKKMHVHDASVKSTLEVHHRKESSCCARTPPIAQGKISYVPCQLQRTRSDDTEARLSSGNLEYSNKVSPAFDLESNIPPDDSSIPPQSITSSSTSNILFTSADSNLQIQNSPLQSKFNIPMNVQSLSQLRRTRSDDTEVRLGSGNLEYSSKVSPAVGLVSNIPPDDSSIPPQSITRSSSTSNIVVTSAESNLQVQNNPLQSQFNVPMNVQSLSQLRRTRSDDTEVRLSSGNLEYSSKVSPAVGLEINLPPADSSVPPQSTTRSSSTSNIVVTSAESNLQVQNNPLQSQFNVPMNVQSLSEMSQCPKKRFKRAHEASFLQSDVTIPSKIPAAKTGSDVAKPAHPCGPRKRGRPRGSKKTSMVSKAIPVMKQCTFCQFATTSRHEMKNHVNEKHFHKYSIKAIKSNNVASIPDQLARLNDEVSASLPGGKGRSTKSFKIKPSLEHVRPRRNTNVSKEISNMQRTGTDHCLHCDHYFPDTISLARHQRIHHNEKQNFRCRLCDFCSSAPGPLVYHINKTHSKELKGGCCPFRDCSRRFSTVKEVKDHLNDHWIEKQFACKICGVRYQVLSSLKAHLDRHSQNFPNICKDYHIYMTIWNVETASYVSTFSDFKCFYEHFVLCTIR
ncbi:uncharacterized protein LOC121407503 isoform X2 [Lytechinus variegatus]|uniref:uncharacterized protein LOC121407503 isoform X2 n=1 Tax=Lytechinus variegatus TaxID=7654 RepID=UPI001BB28122|nr:uncharacterized protein LOC121407503 isoform X2 [Lytechinus variegatus]XP_041454550.1 uncharacterized protein LOC121407503 isoform X2 [Lytechinus variegatus]XP_041454551.1 uncharacterized protein LOC121407503 isoform X2 [Lytechinus variegatus]XP_041454552.1 uncharacterized protein LOC121407503 isoform X2 [Lytechinus variegatus]XP_041454553.1 uncharacterized protein LOC121407503 isoform X2 [Lytechinus variegatus]XP_041454554.1 uncharacterized protein LOC121407503 isoform X2 [Lytechinus varie